MYSLVIDIVSTEDGSYAISCITDSQRETAVLLSQRYSSIDFGNVLYALESVVQALSGYGLPTPEAIEKEDLLKNVVITYILDDENDVHYAIITIFGYRFEQQLHLSLEDLVTHIHNLLGNMGVVFAWTDEADPLSICLFGIDGSPVTINFS